jgi:uncharacterized membrane protein
MSTVREVHLPRQRGLRPALRARAWVTDPAAIFIVLSAMFGTVMVAITPPLRGPDEAAHFLRAYAIAQGNIITSQTDAQGRKGIFLAPHFHEQFALLEARHAHERRPFRAAADQQPIGAREADPVGRHSVFVRYMGSEGYAPASYLPHAAAALAARLIELDFPATLYLMRLTGLLATTLMAAYAIILVPSLKWAFVAIAMLPAALYGRTVINADGGTLAFAMVVAALCLRGTPLTQGRAQHAVWMALCVLSKPPNIAFVLLQAMRTPVRDLARYWRSVVVIIGPAMLAVGLWIAASSGDAGTWRLVALTGASAEQFDPVRKLRFMLEQPLHFPTAMLASFSDPGELWRQLIGVLGLFDTALQPWVYPAVSIGLGAACLTRVNVSARHRAAAVAAFSAGAYALAVLAVFYLVWTPIDATDVWGVQGRYFIPALPVIAIALACLVDRGLSEGTRATFAVAGSLLVGCGLRRGDLTRGVGGANSMNPRAETERSTRRGAASLGGPSFMPDERNAIRRCE